MSDGDRAWDAYRWFALTDGRSAPVDATSRGGLDADDFLTRSNGPDGAPRNQLTHFENRFRRLIDEVFVCTLTPDGYRYGPTQEQSPPRGWLGLDSSTSRLLYVGDRVHQGNPTVEDGGVLLINGSATPTNRKCVPFETALAELVADNLQDPASKYW